MYSSKLASSIIQMTEKAAPATIRPILKVFRGEVDLFADSVEKIDQAARMFNADAL